MLPRRQRELRHCFQRGCSGAESGPSTYFIWSAICFKKIFFLILKAEIVANIEKSWISIFFRNLHSHVAYPAGAERGSLQSLACPLPAPLR